MNVPSPSGLERLAIGARTGFVLNGAGRILRANDPIGSAGPLFYIAGCAEGNLFLLRHDVSVPTARDLSELARSERPLAERHSLPVHMPEYVGLLERDFSVTRQEIQFNYQLPNNLDFACDAATVRSGTAEGDALYANLKKNGVPEGLREMGFTNENEFWEPWCVALHESEPAAVAFAARLTDDSAAAGVATAKALRGKGLAAAATAAWAGHPQLAGLTLGYSHNRDNRSSQRVTERLGLKFFGVSAAIY